MAGDPNNPDGGLLERFTGFYIPILDVKFNGATPPNSPYPTDIYTIQYDGIADAPQYPLNVVSDLNAFLGYFIVHSNYPTLTASQVANAVHLATSPGYTGVTQYYEVMTQNLPLIQFIRDIPYAGPPIADIFQPDLRVLVDLGYGDMGPGYEYANIPTPASLLSIPNVGRVATDLALGAVQGPWSAVVDIVVESGYTPATSWYPDAYPYLPSPDPHLHIYLGQPSTTGLSRLSGGLGNVLELIPPNLSNKTELSPERGILADGLVTDQAPQQRGAELGGDFLGGAPPAGPQPSVAAQRHTDVAQRQDVRVALEELAAGDPAVDEAVHVVVDLSLFLADLGDLLGGEPLGDVGLLLEVHGGALRVTRDPGEQPDRVLVERFAGGPGRIVMDGGERTLGGLAVDVEQDQRLARVVVIDRRLVQPDHIGDVVHPGAVIATRGEQLGGNTQ